MEFRSSVFGLTFWKALGKKENSDMKRDYNSDPLLR